MKKMKYMMNPEERVVNKSFRSVYDHVSSDTVDIYTITAVLWKNSRGWVQQLVRSVVSFFAQTNIPPVILYNTIVDLDKDFCPGSGTWEDKTISTIVSLYLLVHFVRKCVPFMYSLTRTPKFKDHTNEEWGNAKVLMHAGFNLYLHEGVYMMGVFSNLFSLCVNTVACIVVMMNTRGSIDIVIAVFAIFHLHDIPQVLVNNSLKNHAKKLLELSFREVDRDVIPNRFDTYLGFGVFVMTLMIFPVLCLGTLILTAGSVIYMPICRA